MPSCQDVTAKMMELLYGELPEGERAAIDAHVAGCAQCRAELASFERTRAVARQALDEEPPARARQAILAAAAAAAGARTAVPRAARAATALEPRARETDREPERSSFWARLRGRWTLPTFATVGAVAVFLLGSRLFMDPAKTYERGKAVLAPAPSVTSAVSPSSVATAAPAAADEKAGSADSDRAAALRRELEGTRAAMEKASTEAKRARANAEADVPARSGAVFNHAASPAPVAAPAAAGASYAHRHASAGSDKRTALKDAGEGVAPLSATSAGGRALGAPAKGSVLGGGSAAPPAAGGPAASDLFTPPPPPKAKPAKKESAGDGDDLEKAFAAAPRVSLPPPPRVATDPLAKSAPAPASAEAPRDRVAAKHKARMDDVLDGLDSLADDRPSSRAAPRPSAAPAPAAPPVSAAAAPAPAAEPAAALAANARGKGTAPAGAAHGETLRARADRLFAEGRWAEAAAAYRKLLRSEPDSADAERWRQRLAAATRSDAEAVAARAAARAPAKAAKAAKQPAAADEQETR